MPSLNLLLRDSKGNTCLHYACQQTTEKMSTAILKANGEIKDDVLGRNQIKQLVRAKNNQGET